MRGHRHTIPRTKYPKLTLKNVSYNFGRSIGKSTMLAAASAFLFASDKGQLTITVKKDTDPQKIADEISNMRGMKVLWTEKDEDNG